MNAGEIDWVDEGVAFDVEAKGPGFDDIADSPPSRLRLYNA